MNGDGSRFLDACQVFERGEGRTVIKPLFGEESAKDSRQRRRLMPTSTDCSAGRNVIGCMIDLHADNGGTGKAG